MTSIREIQQTICADFNVTREQLIGPSRKAGIVAARHAGMARARETGASLQKIGREFGGRHHATVLHGIRRATHG